MDENNAKLVPKSSRKPDKMVSREVPQMVIHKLIYPLSSREIS